MRSQDLVCTQILVVHPIWPHCFTRDACWWFCSREQLACQGIIATTSEPLRVQAEVEPWHAAASAGAAIGTAFGAINIRQVQVLELVVVIASEKVGASSEASSKSFSSLHRGKDLGLDLSKYFKSLEAANDFRSLRNPESVSNFGRNRTYRLREELQTWAHLCLL